MKKGDDEYRYQYGRRGDQLVTTFQCDRCHVRNILWREPRNDNMQDRLLMTCLRRAILDSLWSREVGTVSSTYGRARALEQYGKMLGIGQVGPAIGPFPLEDMIGMKVALAMVMKSVEPGRNAPTLQYDTIRQLRSAYSNMYHAGVEQSRLTIFSKEASKLHATQCPTDGPWFGRFCLGMEKRLGRQIKQDMALSIEVMLEVQKLLKRDWNQATNGEERKRVVIAATLFLGTFCWGLRGEELLLISLGATRQVWGPSQNHPTAHVMLALVGRQKRLVGERAFLLPCVPVTKSGLEPALWLGRTLTTMEENGRVNGFLLQNVHGKTPRLADYAEIFVSYLTEVQNSNPGLIPPELDIGDEFGIARSGRRGVTTHARNVGVHKDDIDSNQMWRKTELNVGRAYRHSSMLQYYTEVSQSLRILLRFSKPL